MKQDYELMLVLNPALDQDEIAGARERVRDLITRGGGEITADEEWGTRRLAYSIKKTGQVYLEGTYYLTNFNAEKAVAKALETHFRLSAQVLRHLLVKGAPPPKKEDPPKGAETPEPVTAENPESEERVE